MKQENALLKKKKTEAAIVSTDRVNDTRRHTRCERHDTTLIRKATKECGSGKSEKRKGK